MTDEDDTPRAEYLKMKVQNKQSELDDAERSLIAYINDYLSGLNPVSSVRVYDEKLKVRCSNIREPFLTFQEISQLFPWHEVGESSTYGEQMYSGSITLVEKEDDEDKGDSGGGTE